MPAKILYLNTAPDDRIQGMVVAGMRRYAATRGWDVEAIHWAKSRPEDIAALLAARRPVAGCVVECSDGNSRLLPTCFGQVPIVYLHAAPYFAGGRVSRISTDNGAVAMSAYRELAIGLPSCYAVVGVCWNLSWANDRITRFQSLCAESGSPCHVFPFRDEPKAERMARLASWVQRLPCKTAVFAVNDRTAAEVADAARASHRPIPRELALLGVDKDDRVCLAGKPTISSIQIDAERVGYMAARMIGSAPATPATAVVGPILAVRRESTGGFGRREPFALEAVEMIRREACDGLTAESLAARFRCSRSLFKLRFREATGHSAFDEIMHVRLEKVFTLLARTETRIGAIA